VLSGVVATVTSLYPDPGNLSNKVNKHSNLMFDSFHWVPWLELFQGRKTLRSFWHTIKNAPSRGSFLFSCVLLLSVIPCRLTCTLALENVILTVAIFACFPYLFFFCRLVWKMFVLIRCNVLWMVCFIPIEFSIWFCFSFYLLQ